MNNIDERIVKVLRILSDRIALSDRQKALDNGLSPDTCYSPKESCNNSWEPIKKMLEE